jgi:hypothetical protein
MIPTIAPHTRIDNDIILNMADIGVYCYAVYSAIKMHVNQATGACFPSYATLARITGINRSTVIQCVKKLTALKLVSPHWRFKDDGSHTSNQYDFQGTGTSVPSKKVDDSIHIHAQEISGASNQDSCDKGGCPKPPLLVAEDDQGSRPEPPEPSEGNKKRRTISEVDFLAEKNPPPPMPTTKQQTCSHPVTEIVFLRDDVTVCNHCYSLLDEHFRPQEEKTVPEIVAA